MRGNFTRLARASAWTHNGFEHLEILIKAGGCVEEEVTSRITGAFGKWWHQWWPMTRFTLKRRVLAAPSFLPHIEVGCRKWFRKNIIMNRSSLKWWNRNNCKRVELCGFHGRETTGKKCSKEPSGKISTNMAFDAKLFTAPVPVWTTTNVEPTWSGSGYHLTESFAQTEKNNNEIDCKIVS